MQKFQMRDGEFNGDESTNQFLALRREPPPALGVTARRDGCDRHYSTDPNADAWLPEIKSFSSKGVTWKGPLGREQPPGVFDDDEDGSEDPNDDLLPVELRDDAAANADAPEGLEAETSRARANPVFAADPSKDSDELLVIQFPTELPAALPRRRPRSDSNEGRAFDDVRRLKPGKIGTLQLLASGDVRLKMGGETFDVDRGLFQSQAQQICAVDASEGQLCVLGDVETKLVCTTHVDSEDDEPMDLSKLLAKAMADKERMSDD